jgi:hypothetical protein
MIGCQQGLGDKSNKQAMAQPHQEISDTILNPPISTPAYQEIILYCGNHQKSENLCFPMGRGI